MVEKNIYKTRLCKLYQRGSCHRQSCTFAHGEAELRRFLHGSRQDHRGNDLRDKLDRRRSPIRSYSPERDQRGRREFNGDGARSLRRDGKHRKKQHGDDHIDFSGSLRVSKGTEDKAREIRRESSETKDFNDEQMRKLQSEINLLDEHKHRLENYLDERIKESGSLTAKIQDLELQLSQEKDESRRITSKIKKFVKAYNRRSRTEDELKRSQAEFETVCDQFGLDSYRLTDEEGLGFNPSDEEIPADDVRNQKTNDSLSKKRLRVNTKIDELTLQGEVKVGKGKKTTRAEKTSRRNSLDCSDNSKKSETNGIAKNVLRTVDSNNTKHAISDITMISKIRVSEPAVLFPSNSMAARAVDDFIDIFEAVEKIEMTRTHPSVTGVDNELASKFPTLPLPPPPPPRIPENTYAKMMMN